MVVEQAISRCRNKLAQDPTFPPAQFLLGKLLHSIHTGRSNGDDDDGGMTNHEKEEYPIHPLQEVADLSWQAGSCEDRPLESSQKIEALLRAATTYRELGKDLSSVTAYVYALMYIPDQSLVEELLHDCTTLLISQMDIFGSHHHHGPGGLGTIDDTVHDNGDGTILSTSDSIDFAHLATNLTNRFPKSIIVWQFQGAIARKLGHAEVAYQAYHMACTVMTKDDVDNYAEEDDSLLEQMVQSNILASSAARAAGKPINIQMGYLEHALQYTQRMKDDDSSSLVARQRRQRRNLLNADILSQMGTVQKAVGQADVAIQYFQAVLEIKPGDGQALTQLASLQALSSESTSSVQELEDDYVRELFDGYASRFENELVHLLDYQGHIWVANELQRALTSTQVCRVNDSGSMDYTIVDIGCGTGLVGDYLVEELQLPSRILGVDLSERMVKIAEARTRRRSRGINGGEMIYESVHQGNAVDYLNGQPKGSIHGIVAADVFIYVGSLESIFQSSQRVLIDSGVLVFSVELSPSEQEEEKGGGMILLSSGRFGHSKTYIETEASKAGFRIKVWKEGNLRKQRGEMVLGAVVVLEKIL